MNVKFACPRTPSALDVDVDPELTALETIHELVRCDALLPVTDRREYGLVHGRTHLPILPGRTLRAAGVADGDVVEVVQAMEGAR
ncbi:hypothetical protein HY631_04515 [Candidatus Uhrbacteria bacterium]|nr:hypothetical protein [Candidatus Uhrbacteria bacterium]